MVSVLFICMFFLVSKIPRRFSSWQNGSGNGGIITRMHVYTDKRNKKTWEIVCLVV